MESDLRFRTFSAPFNINKAAPAFLYAMDLNRVVVDDAGNSTTGAMVPIAVNESGSINFVKQESTYQPYFNAITGSQLEIPAGALSWSVYVDSGIAFVNGVQLDAFLTLQGGGYGKETKLNSPIVVGCTGSASFPSRAIINWEV